MKDDSVVKGSYTVEAAFIFPIILFIILMLLYFSFYLHDISKIKGVVDQGTIKGILLIKDEVGIQNGRIDYNKKLNYGGWSSLEDLRVKQNKIKEYVRKQLNTGLIISDISKLDINMNSSTIEIKVRAKMNISLKPVQQIFLKNKVRIEIKMKVPVHNPADFIRKYNTIKEKINDTH